MSILDIVVAILKVDFILQQHLDFLIYYQFISNLLIVIVIKIKIFNTFKTLLILY